MLIPFLICSSISQLWGLYQIGGRSHRPSEVRFRANFEEHRQILHTLSDYPDDSEENDDRAFSVLFGR